ETTLAAKIEKLASSLRGKYAALQKQKLYEDLDRLKSGVKFSSADKYLPLAYEQAATVLDYADKDTLFFVCESGNCKERVTSASKLSQEEIKALFEEGELCKGLDKFYLTP